MKKALISTLIFLFLFNSWVYALPFSEQKLLELKPLLSERLKTKAEVAKNTKVFPALILGLLGAAVISANQEQSEYASNENARLSNLSYGCFFLAMGADLYLTKTEAELDLELLDSSGRQGIDREETAYLIFKKNGAEAKLMRERAGFIWVAGGITFVVLPLLVPNVSSDTRSVSTAVGVVFGIMGLMQYFLPSAAETEMEKIDAELGKQ